MARSVGEIRAEVIQRMSSAIKAGKSASGFLREMKSAGLGYRRTDFLGDWRSVGNVKKKEGLIRYVRKGYQPSPALYAEVTWQTSREYMYKVKVRTRLEPGKPIVDRFVNVVSDLPMTPGQIEAKIEEMWGGWYPDAREEIEEVIPETAIKRVT